MKKQDVKIARGLFSSFDLLPGEVEDGLAEEGAHADDEEDVEDGGADDGADADVGEGDKDADDGGEELRRGSSCGHEGGAGHVLGAADDLDDDVERGDKELVAHDGQRHEHVDEADDVEDDGASPPRLEVEEVGREQRVLLVFGPIAGKRVQWFM